MAWMASESAPSEAKSACVEMIDALTEESWAHCMAESEAVPSKAESSSPCHWLLGWQRTDG